MNIYLQAFCCIVLILDTKYRITYKDLYYEEMMAEWIGQTIEFKINEMIQENTFIFN